MNQVDESFFSNSVKGPEGYVMTAGRLTAQKNQAMLIRAFASIAGKRSGSCASTGRAS